MKNGELEGRKRAVEGQKVEEDPRHVWCSFFANAHFPRLLPLFTGDDAPWQTRNALFRSSIILARLLSLESCRVTSKYVLDKRLSV